MAIQLYRKGNTHTVRGVECEVQNFSLAESLQVLQSDEGWVRSEQELVEKVEEKEEKPKRGRPPKDDKAE